MIDIDNMTKSEMMAMTALYASSKTKEEFMIAFDMKYPNVSFLIKLIFEMYFFRKDHPIWFILAFSGWHVSIPLIVGYSVAMVWPVLMHPLGIMFISSLMIIVISMLYSKIFDDMFWHIDEYIF